VNSKGGKEGMKKHPNIKKSLSVLLALVMTLTLAPMASAAGVSCPYHPSVTCKETVIIEATCSQQGKIQYECPKCEYSTVKDTPINGNNHEYIYTDNGDGTHSGVCRYHVNATRASASHTYRNGVCELCGASDYSAVVMDLPSERVIPVALGDSSAKLTAGDVRLTLGTSNITDEYNIDYLWYDYNQGDREVSDEASYPLPASVYNKEGTYYYTLIVSAKPKDVSFRAPLIQTCRITVKVAERISVSAVMSTEDETLRLGDSTVWTPESISNQIYDAVQSSCGRSAEPDYVVFTDTVSTNVGRLNVLSGHKYYFDDSNNGLENVIFTAVDATGDYIAGFTAYDTNKKAYDGVLTVTVQQYAGDMDVVYAASRNAPLTLTSKEFESFWEKQCPNGALEYIVFDQLPRSVDGTLYIDYTATGLSSDTVRRADEFYVSPSGRQYGIESVTFIPSVGVKQSNYITLDFTAYGVRSTGRDAKRSGVIYIFFADSETSADVPVSVPNTGTIGVTGTPLNPAAFRTVYEKMTGTAAGSFSIQLLDVPSSGALFLNRTTASNGIRLTSDNITGRPFAYNGSKVETIADLTYVPGTQGKESIRYVASSAQGKPLFAGNINFTSAASPSTGVPATGLTVDYTSPATGVAFRGSDFVNAQGANQPALTSVCFTPPTSLYGTLYYGRTATSTGTAITTSANWFSTASSIISGSNCIDDITFVPALSYTSGTVTIPFTALTSAGTRVGGNVRITVGSGSVVTPPTTTPTTPPTDAKTFKDVPVTAYYYKYVTELTTTGVLSGYEDNTFRPDNTVNLGEALKMIMTSAGYPEQAPVDSEWASGYLARAKADNLLPAGTIERLDRPVDRYTIAEITARAMRLQPGAVSVSPFADMAADHASAPAVTLLNQLGILIGSTNKNNQMIYQGQYAIKRCDFAIIIWRVQNYVRTGNVNGTVTQ